MQDAGLFLCCCHTRLTEYRETLLLSFCLFIFRSTKASCRYSEIRCSSASRSMFGSIFLFFWMNSAWKSEWVFTGGLHTIGVYACLVAWMCDWRWWRKWLSNETPLKSVTWGEGCYIGGEGGEKTKQDKKSEKLICLSNQREAAESARQPQLHKLAGISWLTVSLVPHFDLLTLKL